MKATPSPILKAVPKAAIFAAWGFCALVFLLPLLRQQGYLWDFYAYYCSMMAHRMSQNPYAREWIGVPLMEKTNSLRYIYPPLSIYYFYPWAAIPAAIGVKLFYTLKLAALAGLAWLWNRHFLPLSWRSPGTLLFFLFAFNGTLVWDLYANNITLFEQLGIWLALYFLLKNRLIAFAALILFVAQFKLTPAALLLLLLFVPTRPAWGVFFGACATFGTYLLANYLLLPGLTQDFLRGVQTRSGQPGILTPGSYGFINHASILFNTISLPAKIPESGVPYLFLLYAACIGALMLALVLHKRKAFLGSANEAEKWQARFELILIFLMAHSLLHWRYASYQYVQVLIPALYFLRKAGQHFQVPLIAFFLFWPHHFGDVLEESSSHPLPAPIHKFTHLAFEYLPFTATLLLFVLWAVYEGNKTETRRF